MSLHRTDILLASGNFFDFMFPEKSVFTVADIAHSLANECRFCGHTREFYSVAQHSVLASHIVPPEHAMAALFHDAAEAFVKDIPKPLKRLLPDYAIVEHRVEAAIFKRLGIAYPLPACVKEADAILLATEKRDLMPHNGDYWEECAGARPLTKVIKPWASREARELFMHRYDQLAGV